MKGIRRTLGERIFSDLQKSLLLNALRSSSFYQSAEMISSCRDDRLGIGMRIYIPFFNFRALAFRIQIFFEFLALDKIPSFKVKRKIIKESKVLFFKTVRGFLSLYAPFHFDQLTPVGQRANVLKARAQERRN